MTSKNRISKKPKRRREDGSAGGKHHPTPVGAEDPRRGGGREAGAGKHKHSHSLTLAGPARACSVLAGTLGGPLAELEQLNEKEKELWVNKRKKNPL